MRMRFTMPVRTLDYLLMGIVAGIIAGVILVYVFGITYYAFLNVAETLRMSFRIS